MADPEDELLKYEDVPDAGLTASKKVGSVKAAHVGIHSAGFRDFLLSPELNHAIGDAGFEHPSQVQQECIPQALLGTDVICQGKSGLGKTAVFVISILHQLVPVPGEIQALVLAPTRELAFQICSEFTRFSKYMPLVKSLVLFGGFPKSDQIRQLKQEQPSIVIGCPGRILGLAKEKDLDVSKVRYFVIDEVDRCLHDEYMEKDIVEIVKKLPVERQSLLFSATMPEAMKEKCRQFCRNPVEVYVDDDKKLTLHGLQQYYVRLEGATKTRKLVEILDNFKFNQMVVFVRDVKRAETLDHILNECGYPSLVIHARMEQAARIKGYAEFKSFRKKILVSTDLFSRGIDVERVNIVVNYDLPQETDTYLHRVGRAGRFGTKGLAISFVATERDDELLKDIQSRFEVTLTDLPASVDPDGYMNQ